MEEGMKIKELLYILKQRWLTVLITCIFVSSTIGGIIFGGLKPVYEFSTQVVLNSVAEGNSSALYSDKTNEQLIASYVDMAKGSVIMQQTIEQLDLNYSIYELQKQISVTNSENSQIINIVVQDKHPERVKQISTTVAIIAKDKIKEFMKEREFNLISDDVATEAPEKVFPKTAPSIAISLIMGILAGIVIAFLRHYFHMASKRNEATEAWPTRKSKHSKKSSHVESHHKEVSM
jgi:capsular polysaccharide biosynthesis protein